LSRAQTLKEDIHTRGELAAAGTAPEVDLMESIRRRHVLRPKEKQHRSQKSK
jgi:hypothetical protein